MINTNVNGIQEDKYLYVVPLTLNREIKINYWIILTTVQEAKIRSHHKKHSDEYGLMGNCCTQTKCFVCLLNTVTYDIHSMERVTLVTESVTSLVELMTRNQPVSLRNIFIDHCVI